MDRNHRLDVQVVNLVIVVRARGEVEVILERHADEISHGILCLLHKFCVFVFLLAGFLWFRSPRVRCCEEKKS